MSKKTVKKASREPGFHLYKSTLKGTFYWDFVSSNGRPIAKSSRGHKTKQGAVQSIKSILSIVDAQDRTLYYDHTRLKSKEDQPNLFVIK
jgi:uncharacterized protein YegP (UPF0339 family)